MKAASLQSAVVVPFPDSGSVLTFSPSTLPKVLPTHSADYSNKSGSIPRILVATQVAHSAFLRGITHFARENGWQLDTDMLHTGVLPEEAHCDGMIVLHAQDSNACLFNGRAGFPCVAVNMTGIELEVPSVRPNDFQIGRFAGEYLIARGCKEFIWAPYLNDAQNQTRFEGFQHALAEAGKRCTCLPPAHTKNGRNVSSWWNEWRRSAQDLLKTLEDRAGLFAFNDCLSSELAAVAKENGLSIPNDLAILGVGNEEIECESTATTLSSIDPGLEQLSYAAAKLLNDIINGKIPATNLVSSLPPLGVVDRQSTAFSSGKNPRVERALRYIAEKYSDPSLSVSSVADALRISRRQLERDFRSENGLTVREYIEKSRMERAARLLIEQPEENISTIAKKVGISESGNFFRIFRRRFDMTPSAFRNQSTG